MTKEKLLELFESNKGIYFSGEEIAGKLGVSRAAVWKAVNNLRNDGYAIDAVTNKGYCLSEKSDILSPQGIQKYLNSEYADMELTVLQTVDSTNKWIREKADHGFPEGYTAISNEQTSGRGRYGREFFSPPGTGIYLSILLRPSNYSAQQAVRLTTMAAVAVCEAIEEISDETAQIKWVNDIYVKGKKICGILTEASFGLESGMLEYAVVGIGINLYTPQNGFPEELSSIAGALFDHSKDDAKNHLAAAFLNYFMKYYTAQSPTDYVEKYRNRNLAIGKQITFINGNKTRNAYVCGIDDECRLIVRYENGELDHLAYGEIKIRL